MKNIDELFKGNDQWIEEMVDQDPGFFKNLSHGQHPDYLWIGCSDSRVGPAEITHQKPGTMFIHRNIANVVDSSDMNLLSVAYYAVKFLKIKHIVVCGHYGCGGISAAMNTAQLGFIDNWLIKIKDVYVEHETELLGIQELEERKKRLVELNVIHQVQNLEKISFIQEALNVGRYPYIHGLVMDISSGRLINLDVTTNSTRNLDDIFKYD